MEPVDKEKMKAALDRFERFLHLKDLRLTEARAAIVEAARAGARRQAASAAAASRREGRGRTPSVRALEGKVQRV
jgi:transcription elongation GreA/GreB family factor